MPEQKKYIVQIPGEEQVAYWDEAKFKRNQDQLYQDHQDAQVTELSSANLDSINDSDSYWISIPNDSHVAEWDGAKLKRNREQLLADYPTAQVYKTNRHNYGTYVDNRRYAAQAELDEVNKGLREAKANASAQRYEVSNDPSIAYAQENYEQVMESGTDMFGNPATPEMIQAAYKQFKNKQAYASTPLIGDLEKRKTELEDELKGLSDSRNAYDESLRQRYAEAVKSGQIAPPEEPEGPKEGETNEQHRDRVAAELEELKKNAPKQHDWEIEAATLNLTGDAFVKEMAKRRAAADKEQKEYASRLAELQSEYDSNPLVVLDNQIAEGYSDMEKYAKQMADIRATNEVPSYQAPGAIMTAKDASLLSNKDYTRAQVAYTNALDRVHRLEMIRDNTVNSFWVNAGDAALNPSNWTFGLGKLYEMGIIMDAQKHQDEESAQEVMKQAYLQSIAQAEFDEKQGNKGQWGRMTGDMAQFIILNALGGSLFEGIGEAAASKVTGKVAEEAAISVGKKFLGAVTKDATMAALTANTVGLANTITDILQRHEGYIVQNEDGTYDFDGGEGWWKSIWNGETEQFTEYFTERMGEHFGAVGGRIAGSKIGQKLGLKAVSKFVAREPVSGFEKGVKNFFKVAGIQNYPSEVLEEELGIVMSNMLQLNPAGAWEGLTDAEQQADIFGGMAFSIGLMQSVPFTTHIGVSSYNRIHNAQLNDRVNRASADATRVFGDLETGGQWAALKDRIDNAANEDVTPIVYQIATNENLSADEKKAALTYVDNLMRLRGFSTGVMSEMRQAVMQRRGEAASDLLGKFGKFWTEDEVDFGVDRKHEEELAGTGVVVTDAEGKPKTEKGTTRKLQFARRLTFSPETKMPFAEGFVVGEEDGKLLLTTGEGKLYYLEADALSQMTEMGAATDSGRVPMYMVLDQKADDMEAERESQRMEQERQSNANNLMAATVPGTKVNIGTEEAENEATVQGFVNGQFVLLDSNGEQKTFTPEQMAGYLKMPYEPKTDAELDEIYGRADEKTRLFQNYQGRSFIHNGVRHTLNDATITPDQNGNLQVQLTVDDDGTSANSITVTEQEADDILSQIDGDLANSYNDKIKKGSELRVNFDEDTKYYFQEAVMEEGSIIIKAIDPDSKEIVDLTPEMISNLDELTQGKEQDANGNPVPETPAVTVENTEPTEYFDDPVANALGIGKEYVYVTKKGQRVVDRARLWNDSPELWARWYDQQPNKSMSTKEFLADKLKQAGKEVKTAQNDYKAEEKGAQNPDKLEELQDRLDAKLKRQTTIQNLYDKYEAAEKAAKEEAKVEETPVETPAEVAAPVAEATEEAPAQVEAEPVQEEVPLTPDQVLEVRLAEAKTPEEKRQALEEYYASTTTDPTVVGTRADILQRMEELRFSERVIGQVRDQLNAKGVLTEGFHIGDMVFIVADDIRDARRAKLAHLHEHWHEINRVQGYHRTAAEIPGATTEYLLDVANRMAGVSDKNGYADYLDYPNPQQALADEVIALSMEVISESTPENVDENLRNAGLDNLEIINFVKTIYNGERGNDQEVDSSGRDTLPGDNAQEGERQDGGDIAPQPEGILGEQGSGSGEGSDQGTGGGAEQGGEVTLSLSPIQQNAVEFVEGDKTEPEIRLENAGLAANPDEVRFSVRYSPTAKEANQIASDIAKEVGVPLKKAKEWVKSETSLASIILDEVNTPYLNYEGDDRYTAIKNDSDYPQGTVDFNNICRKRLAFTDMYQRIQKAFPNTIITGEDLATIRNIMKKRGLTVACGLCYVEDRRQLLGEIANGFIQDFKDGFKGFSERKGFNDKPGDKGDVKTRKKVADELVRLVGNDTKEDLSIYDLLTLSGSQKLYEEHRGIYDAFQRYNKARGQQSGNLFQGYAEYKREILKWSKAKVKSVNANGGLRIFSYSDFEAHHLIDLVQIIQDCARKGVMIQGYTKVPAFARAIAQTGIKLNRSLIPLGDTGIVDGKLAYDSVEGIDINDPDFLESNENVGNILIGINDEQIAMAMEDPFVHYIIPYHSNQSGVLRQMKQTGAWTNYKNEQGEKGGKEINIYKDVLAVAEAEGNPIQNERQFVDKFLAVCKERGLTPRFWRFLNVDENGDYAYRPGYYKLLLDFKLFDEQGNILPQKPVQAAFDDEFNAQILNDYVKGERAKLGENLDEVYDEIVKTLGLEKREPDVRFRMANANQKTPEAIEPVVTDAEVDEEILFRLSKNNKATVESWLKKRDDLSDEQKAEVVNYIDNLDDAKTQLATAKWFANGKIRIPEDMPKVKQAISVAGKAKVDPLQYDSPMALLDAHAEFKPSEERINPDEVSTLHRAAEYPDAGIVVYDVDNTKESRENMRKIINTHFGEAASPWCLLQGDGKGNLTKDSERYWKHYNAYPKQVAFKDGKLLAFSANDKRTRLWWDRQDQSHYGIPVTQKVEGDELGRSAYYIIEDGQLVREPGTHLFKGNKQNGVYEEWSSDGNQILERTNYKDGEEDGLTESWYFNGQMQRRTTMKDGNYAGRYEAWFDNGQKQVDMTLTEEGFNDGERRAWWKNGNLRSEGRYKNSKRVGEHRTWDEDGTLQSVQYYSEDADFLGYEDHGRWGIEKKVTFTDDGGQEMEKFSRGGHTISVERTNKKGRLNGLQELNFIDGTPHVRATYSDGVLDGIREIYFPNGKLQARGEYKNGASEGIHEIWNRDGDLVIRQEYHNDEKVRTLPLDEPATMFRKAFDSAEGELGAEQVSVDNPDLMQEYNLSNVTMTKKGDVVTLNKVVVADQKKGNGTRFMQDLTKEADNEGWTLALTPDDSFGATSVGRLKKFYKRFGFKENKGRNADLTINESMIRKPEEVRFRLSNREQMDQDYMAAVEAGDMETAQAMVDNMAEAAGYNIRGYHGTTHDFTIFDRSKGNAEGNWGKGFYFTNNLDDAEANYAGEGPDLTNRIELLAENMAWMDGYEDMTDEQRLEEARKQLAGDNPHVITAAIKMENPVVFDSRFGEDETYFDYNSGYNELTDEYEGEESGLLVDFINAWNDVMSDMEWEGNNISPDEILEYGEYDGLTASQLEKKAREILDSRGIEDSEGQAASGEFLRQVFERMGFDGILDKNVNQKFGTQRRYGRSMEGVDYGTTHVVAFNSNQIKQSDPVTYDDDGKVIPLSQRFDSWNEDIRFRKANQTQNGFISNAEAALDRVKMDKATPEQWIKMLEKEGGLKAGEDKWLGLSDWLKESDKKTLTKDEIADFIEQNRIQIEEQKYSQAASEKMEEQDAKALEEYNEEFQSLVDDYNNGDVPYEYTYPDAQWYAYQTMREKYGEDFRKALQLNGNVLAPVEGMYDEISEEAKRFLRRKINDAERPIDSVRLSYTTVGLANNREIALTVPTIDSWEENDKIHFGDAGEGRAIAWIRFGDAFQDGAVMTEEEKEGLPDYYKGREIRWKPKRVLVIDEIQSNRHQQAREKGGYTDENTSFVKEARDRAEKEWEDYSKELRDKYKLKDDITYVLMQHIHDKATPEEFQKAAKLNQAVNTAQEEWRKVRDRVPAAPFEKNWHELAMKRMLRLAAEEGYDKIAWTTGEQQADRYNLGGVVDKIESTPYKSEGFNVDIVLNNGEVLLFNIDKDGLILSDNSRQDTYKGKNLSDVVGKDIAKKILDSTEDQTISGEGLRVGGEGMRGFYDDILPRFMNKYGKKWGVKVQDINLPDLDEGQGLTMHSVDVTPEMKESVMEGQVMFRLGEKETEEEVEKFKQKYTPIAPMTTKLAEEDNISKGEGDKDGITIFANRQDDEKDAENTCFHENIHSYADKEGIGEDRFKELDALILLGFDEEARKEELEYLKELKKDETYKDFPYEELGCQLLSEAMQSEYIDELFKSAEEDVPSTYELLKDFFEQLNYDARAEAESRRKEDSTLDEESDRGTESGSEQADDAEAGEGQEGREEVTPPSEDSVDEYGDAEVQFRLNQDAVRQSQEGGLTGLIGDENEAELYRNVYKAIPKEIREQIVNRAGDSYLFSEATKDMISEAVEKGDETGIAGLAANMLRDYAGPLDEKTARYILWRGDRKQEDDDILDTVRDIAMQRKLRVGEFAEQPMFRLGEDIEEAENRAESMAEDAKQTLDEKKQVARADNALNTIKAMSIQKEYDRKTVNTLTVLAKNILKDQSIETLNRREIARLLGMITTSIGKAPKTVKKNADALIDLVLGHLLKSEETKLGMLASTRATKTNATGVEVQGTLDVRGQNILKAYKAGLDMNLENPTDEFDENTINGRIAVLTDRLESEDDAVRSEAEDELAGLMLAKEYQENIKASINEERGIKNEMRDAAEQLRDGKISRTAYNEFVAEAEKSIRENRIERIEAYQNLRAKMVSMMAGSIDARKEFTENEKRRVEEIHHLANSDMQGKEASPFAEPTRWSRIANSSLVRFFAKPLVSFDQMLRLFGEKSVAGEGYLWNKFHRGWIEASEKAYLGEKEAKSELDEQVSWVFDRPGMRWSDLYAEERKMPKVKVRWWDGGELKEHELTQGNLLYIYMVNKMTDGRMKLRRMGITQATVDAIKRQMDDRFLELADWVQEKFLVEKRNKYNAVHERLFGASMAAIEDYFPLKINKRSLNKAEDLGRPDFDDALPATTTGSIIKRKRNAQDLDLLNADAFSTVIEHIEQMEQWAAFAEFNKDLNTLLSYKRFRNQVQNMATVYGSGSELWKNFKSVCRIVGGTYSPAGKKSDLDTAALNVAKGVTSAKISFRVYTALKQFLSMPAFLADANIKYFGENLATPWKAWNWAMENLPLFEKRWKSRMAGDTRLMNTDSDWKFFRSQIYDTLSRLGMSPNAFVDALTVSIGAHSIYQTRYDRYIKDGYTEEEADKKAKQDATTLYNETQQSNEAAFVAPVQLDRTVLATMITVFRNSSMGYQRQLHDAIRNIGKMMKPGYKTASIEFMKKQMERDGLTEEQAAHAAERNYNREVWRSAARVATFGFLVEFAWNLGGSIAYLLFGDDDDKKEEMLREAFLHGLLSGSLEGLSGGNVMSDAINMMAKGESLSNYDPSLLPIISDLKSAYKKMSYDPVAGSNDLVNLAIQAGIGVNPQTLTDAVVAVVDACGGDLETSTEAMLLIMRVLQVPQSQIDQIYIDELGVNADKARTMSVGEMAERYARYKVMKGAPLTGWAYSDEAEEKREKAYLKSFKKKVKERNSKK